MRKYFRYQLLIFSLFIVGVIQSSPKILQIPLGTNKINLNPSYALDISSLFISRQINCQLIRNVGGKYKLEAAKKIQYLSPLKLEITLNKIIKFSDGSNVTSSDVLASFNYIKKRRIVYRNIFSWINSIKIVDKNTFLIELSKPVPQILNVLSAPDYAIFKSSFIKQAIKNNNLWQFPIGCGGYKINKYSNDKVFLIPLKKGMPIEFDLIHKNQINAKDASKYDLITLKVVGNKKNLTMFDNIEIFDPSQVYIGINATKTYWNNIRNRCNFLAKVDSKNISKLYKGNAFIANDFLPQGALGYNQNYNFYNMLVNNSKNYNAKNLKHICLAYTTISIPHELVPGYISTIKSIVPKIDIFPISKASKFAEIFLHKKCDVIFFSIKSNYFDGYEYLDIFADKYANFTGINDTSLLNSIKNSQNISDLDLRVKKYREIINEIEKKCYILPLVTIPMRDVYIKKSLSAPGLGVGPYNEYYLGNIELKDMQ